MLCDQCLRTFKPSYEVVLEYSTVTVEFHCRPWELVEKKGAAPDDCLCCAFFVALISWASAGGPSSRSLITGEPGSRLESPQKAFFSAFDYPGEQYEEYHLYRITLNGSQYGAGDNMLDIPILALINCEDPRVKAASPIMPTSNNTASDQSFQKLLKWMDNCSNNHISCCQLGRRSYEDRLWSPTRLIQISLTDDQTVASLRLVETWEEKDIGNHRYATLSYCWGPSPSFITLRCQNLSDFKSSIDMSMLPATFKDAIVAATRLGFRYLWIDALCIIQDSEKDWAQESSMMSKVYSYSCLTLAAAASKDPSCGLFCARSPILVNGIKLNIDWGVYGKGEFQFTRYDSWGYCVHDSPLLKRAWVFQERILSPRTVYFASDQLYWECGELYASELYPMGGPWDLEFRKREYNIAERLPEGLEPSVDGRLKHNYSTIVLQRLQQPGMTTADELLYLWANIVSEYSSGGLTFERDKLVAISGVANRLARLANINDYVAGLWRQNLPLSLLWRSPSQGLKSEYRAPSWSWASVTGRVSMDLIFRAIEVPHIVLEILDINISTESGSAHTGPITRGSIQVKGPLCEAFYALALRRNVTGPLFKHFYDRRLFGGNSRHSLRPLLAQKDLFFKNKGFNSQYPSMIMFDEKPKNHQRIFCLEIANGRIRHPWGDTSFISGLMLSPTGVKGQFCRVGYFEIVPEKMHRSWRADHRVVPFPPADRKSLADTLFRNSNINPEYYEKVENNRYTITII